ncbi:hypothetical protein AAF712_004902 [Marasmius tenuissimus]|uniref:Uncharacterized protein n=1 Tax=Marasmius tenuissimus TaxID=585030 RepID=A0ABR3A3Q4_9AGAR
MSDPSVKANIIGMFLEGIAYEDGTRIVSKLAMLSCGAYVALTSIADIFIVYRVFAVWSRNSIISAIPCSLSIAGIISGGFLVANSGKYGFNEPRHLFTAFYCITLVLNVLSTALIASKLYISERQTKFSSSLKLKWTSVVVIESGAVPTPDVGGVLKLPIRRDAPLAENWDPPVVVYKAVPEHYGKWLKRCPRYGFVLRRLVRRDPATEALDVDTHYALVTIAR